MTGPPTLPARPAARPARPARPAHPARPALPASASASASRPTRPRRRRPPTQLGLDFRTWGGKRRGAGRKRVATRDGVPHRARPALTTRLPVHLTLRLAPRLCDLRARRIFRLIELAIWAAADRFGVRLIRFSVQRTHLHLIVEADDKAGLARAAKGLGVRVARQVNRFLVRRGRVIDERYHAHLLRTPTEVRKALDYVANNGRRHLALRGRVMPAGWIDECSSEAPGVAARLPAPRTWLLRVGWRRGSAGGQPHPDVKTAP